ncbi:inhibitor of apoptosis repeat-containing protein [Macroventuria anomochaeta]|uniref:Inhibitor of apoptosis repeat-containing protein n=1 Tax=Macroventuria anomochaeta TaxID=301207 RepID=A0ACB6RZF9_9PLEO|nr:inhibitor of apoptosis repeat-containing protein [Macroventuria anomochaeta]KAF2626272.1 inhibitor of apoptosis repeat-containing protein [Macroventuria anomochaeta]
MAASLACLQARIDTFSAPATSKSRRTSSKSKKAPSKPKSAWPLALPSAHDLAFAGFVWKPTTASPDNVQCFSCHCQLDGWEENDVPAYEHLTHSPSCGFAVVTCIRLRTGDPGRSEDDPISDAMMQARRDTFGESWPLDSNEGFPSIEQLVEAGWYYDPTLDTPDGATCAYCSLSLDAWDVGDDPMEEHRRRAPDCLFFALKELYHPAPKAASKKGKRASTRTSTASTASKTRGKKRASEQIDDSISSVVEKPTRRKKRTSEQIDDTIEAVKPKATRGKKRASTQIDDTVSSVTEKPTRDRKRASTQIDDTIDIVIEKATRGKKHATEQTDSTMDHVKEEQPSALAPAPKSKAKKAAPRAKRASTASTTTKSRGKKRTSEQIEDTDVVETSPKRIRHSSVSSFPDSLLAGTPKRAPTELAGPEALEVEQAEPEMEDLEADISSLPASLLVGTPKKTPTRRMTPEDVQQAQEWDPVDIDAFFGNTDELQAFMNDVVIDAGLDAIVPAGAIAEDLQAAVLDGLTKSEKEMSVEQWVLYNAKRGEEKLRQACEKQILAFEVQAMRARAAIESLPIY